MIKRLILSLVLVFSFLSDSYGSAKFDGTNDALSSAVSVDLTGTSVISVSFWLYWDAYASDDDLGIELSSNFGANNGSFFIDPNGSGANFEGGITGTGGVIYDANFTRPSAAVWHHYVFIFDYTQASNVDQIKVWVDGSSQSMNIAVNQNATGPFGNYTLFLMTRNNAGLWGAGRLSDVAIYNDALTQSEIDNLALSRVKRTPLQVNTSNLFRYWPLDECADGIACNTASMFKDLSGNGGDLSPSNSPTGLAEEILSYADFSEYANFNTAVAVSTHVHFIGGQSLIRGISSIR